MGAGPKKRRMAQVRPPSSGPAVAGRRPNPSSRSRGRLHLSLVRPVPASPADRFAAAARNSVQCLRRRFQDWVTTSFRRSRAASA